MAAVQNVFFSIAPQRSKIHIYFIFSGCTYIFWVEETDGPIYKLFYCGHFEIQDGHHSGSNLVNISSSDRDSKMISKCMCSVYMRHIMFKIKLSPYPATHTSYMLYHCTTLQLKS